MTDTENKTTTPAPEPLASDPALSDEPGRDWTDEGGATAYGAATDVTEPVPSARQALAEDSELP